MTTVYKRGLNFPHEGFVQSSIEAHFLAAGFRLESGCRADLVCSHPETGESWQVEAKGVTTQIGLDFRTGLGQLLQAMQLPAIRHGIAIPDTPAFRAQVARISPWVVAALGIHWLFVSQDGSVEVVCPVDEAPTD